MDVVVSDTSPLRALAHLGFTDLLSQLFSQVWVPPAVVDELEHPIRTFRSVPVSTFSGLGVKAPANHGYVLELRRTLQAGESEAIALAIELRLKTVIMDEQAVDMWPPLSGLSALG